jgi:signal transduction histidine kinase
LVSLLYLAHLVHLQYVTSRLEDRLRQRSSERIRVAQELHDTLLQSIHGLMLRFHFAAEKLPGDEPARHALQLALSTADEVIVEGRERVQSLREEVLKETDFAEQIGAMALRLDVQQLLSFRITEDGKPKNLRADVRNELCMVAREALTNVIRHSRAARAEISLVYGEREFTMRCCDNGVGMAQSTVKQGSRDQHCGLVDIRERTLAIAGTLEMWSSPGSGTEIEIRVPSRRAYLQVSTPFR